MQTNELPSVIPADFSLQSRVWIYQSSRPFIDKEAKEIEEQLHQFYTQWLSHGEPVKGWAGLLYHQFIVVLADETGTHVSGCSTDGSVRVMKSIERQYSVHLFDRMMLTFLVNDKAQMLPYNQLQYAIDKGYITPDTYLFNNTVETLQQMKEEWLIPIKDSWLAGRVTFSQPTHS
jgi:hypothetical protein